METQVAVTGTKAVATMAQTMTDLGVEMDDIVIPKLLLMQNTSEMVGEEKAKMGDIINSQTLEAVGGLTNPVEIVPLTMKKQWRVYDVSSGNPEYRRSEDVTAQNARLPWDDVDEDGHSIRRDMCYLVYALLLKDVTAGEAFPVVVSFHRSSTNAGKQVATHLFKMASCGKDPMSRSLVLAPRKDKKDTNFYAVHTVGKGRDLTIEETAECRKWASVLKSTKHTVHESDIPAAPVNDDVPF